MAHEQNDKHEGHGQDKEFTIIVNARPKTVTEKRLSFSQIVALAFDTPPTGENIELTVTYRKGHGNKEGTLTIGESVRIQEGMVFYVTETDKS